MQILRFLAITVLSTIAVASSMAAQTVIPAGPFRSIELEHGGHVVVRHGQTQRVRILAGDPRFTRVRVSDGRLTIENCNPDCPRKYRMQIEVVTPQLSAVSVSNGGTVQTAGAFPAQAAIDAAVEQGGTIDIRSVPVNAVNASVYSGGRILINPRQALSAAVASGGHIKYWGDPRVRRSVRHGGVIERGSPADAQKPLSELGPRVPPLPPLPPVPPVR